MRKTYLDNVRILCILLLFPYHTAMIFNNFGEAFYVHGASLGSADLFMSVVYPWWMALLFAVAGISSAYALNRRSALEYSQERQSKLLVPFLAGLVLVIPVQSYIADVFHQGYTGGYFAHYLVYFTRITDLSGYDGGFTPGHTWFMIYLYGISMLMLPLMKRYRGNKLVAWDGFFTLPILLSLFTVLIVLTPVIELGGKSFGEALGCFGLGYFVLSREAVQIKLERHRLLLGGLFVGVLLIRLFMQYSGHGSGLLWDAEQRVVTWFGILAILGLGSRHLTFDTPLTRYFSAAAFPLYYFHQSVLVIVGFFVLRWFEPVGLQFAMIMTAAFLLTLACYEVLRRFKVPCLLFGMKHRTGNGSIRVTE